MNNPKVLGHVNFEIVFYGLVILSPNIDCARLSVVILKEATKYKSQPDIAILSLGMGLEDE